MGCSASTATSLNDPAKRVNVKRNLPSTAANFSLEKAVAGVSAADGPVITLMTPACKRPSSRAASKAASTHSAGLDSHASTTVYGVLEAACDLEFLDDFDSMKSTPLEASIEVPCVPDLDMTIAHQQELELLLARINHLPHNFQRCVEVRRRASFPDSVSEDHSVQRRQGATQPPAVSTAKDARGRRIMSL
mmetsp:Transcript_22311/g.51081  ORF Transcript_22311/g.51081 Transcript_22311/m.51081 type:complete len:191 (-) Transcript_22311:305-877(-)